MSLDIGISGHGRLVVVLFFFSRSDLAIDLNSVALLVVRNIKRSDNVLAIVDYLLFGFWEAFRNKVDWLHFTDWKIDVILSNNIRIEWPELRFIRHAVSELTKTAHDSGAICLLISILV